MNELTKGLTNLRSLRAAIRDLTLEQAESSLLKLQAAVEEKRAQAAEIEQAEQERRARIAKYKELIGLISSYSILWSDLFSILLQSFTHKIV